MVLEAVKTVPIAAQKRNAAGWLLCTGAQLQGRRLNQQRLQNIAVLPVSPHCIPTAAARQLQVDLQAYLYRNS